MITLTRFNIPPAFLLQSFLNEMSELHPDNFGPAPIFEQRPALVTDTLPQPGIPLEAKNRIRQGLRVSHLT
jgi:hypothetical protein